MLDVLVFLFFNFYLGSRTKINEFYPGFFRINTRLTTKVARLSTLDLFIIIFIFFILIVYFLILLFVKIIDTNKLVE